MRIWVDADACPNVIKDILFRAAVRTKVETTLIANHSIRIPPSEHIHFYQVSQGFDNADNEIVQRTQVGDLVITADIPLAAEVINKGAMALNPRGERYSPSTIQAKLTMRNFMDTMRSSGIQTGGPEAISHADRQAFANQLDQILSKQACCE